MAVPRPLLVALGAAVGAGLRWLVDELVGGAPALLLVNTAGALLLGALLVRELPAGARRPAEPTRLLVGVGFCGSLTTFSTLAVDLAIRLDAGRVGSATGLFVSSLGLGLGAVWVGSRLRRGSA